MKIQCLNYWGYLLLALACVTGASAIVAGDRPNVLMIISDDQGWNDYGFMGHPTVETPSLDRLAAESLTFTRGYTPVPLCRPSLATIITGLYPHQHGVTGNDPDLPDKGVQAWKQRGNPQYARYYQTIISNFTRHPNLVRDLTARGYRSLQTGKWWEGNPVKTAGFSHAMTAGEGPGDRHGGAGLTIGREGLKPVTDFIEESSGTPWLVWYAPLLPHNPHTPPQSLLDKYLPLAPTEPVARYWACVEWFDQTCGELLDYLQARGLRESTIILYACDNGWIQDPERRNDCAPRSKLTAYEGGIRTPIMVCWPDVLKPKMDTRHLASAVDLWPTLAALLQSEIPEGLPGIDLSDARAVAKRKRIFGEQYHHAISDVDHPALNVENRWIIDGWWKLIVPNSRNRSDATPQLYDLQDDSCERKDLAVDHSRRVKPLIKKLDTWWQPAEGSTP